MFPPRMLMNGMRKGAEPKLVLIVENGGQRIPELMDIAKKENVEIKSVQMNKPTLEDVFLHHTGRKIRDESSNRMEHIKQMMMLRMRR
ncbi:MAG: ATP-binding protein DrrA1-3 family domain-containing protein, partial [Candidatus Helarchaeales archaeon]